MIKYDITDVANETFPVPSGKRILEIYGKVINGKINDDIVKNAFIIKLIFNDFCFCIVNFYLLLIFFLKIKMYL